MSTSQTPGFPPGNRPQPPNQQNQWNAPRVDPSQEPEPSWKRYLLPGAGAGALILVVAIVALIIATGGDDEEDDTNDVAIGASETATAEMFVTPTPEATEPAPSPTPETDDSEELEITPTPEPEPTEPAVEEEPTPAPTPVPEAPEPTPAPVTGDFGELPPGDIPSGSPADALGLQFNLDMSLQAIPSQATVYQIHRRQWSAEDAGALVNRLEIDGELVDQGNGSFRAEGSAASIYIATTSIQYVRSSTGDVPGLPENEQLVQYARSWLTNNGLVGADIGPGQVLNRDPDSGVGTVLLKPVDPSDIISGTPSARVTVRGDGVVTEATINWPSSLSGSTYGLRSADSLWADATSGRGFVDININDLPPNFQGSTGTVSITSGSIAYTVAGNPQGTQFLVPVAVFSGSANIDGAANPVPVRIYVQAVAAQATPRG